MSASPASAADALGHSASLPPRNSPQKVAVASLIGTAIEFYDYYIYAAAAVLVFNSQFFPKGDPAVATLLSLSTLALAFLARPMGSALAVTAMLIVAVVSVIFLFLNRRFLKVRQ